MGNNLNYEISENNYDEKIYSYLAKISESTISVITEHYNETNEVKRRERFVTHFLKKNIKVEAELTTNKNMIITLPSD